MSGSAAHTSIIDDAWDSVVGSFHWLKSVLLGEFQDNRPLSAIIADMLLSFLPAVVIATSARDAIAVILRMTKHPEKREEMMEWIVLCACLITIALPLVMAAAGAAAAGVGAVVGGIAGSELGAALRAVMLLLAKQATKLVEVIQFLQKFIRGDILRFLRAIKFTKYNQAVISAFRQFALKLLEIVQGMIRHLEALPSIQYTRTIIAKLKTWEREFYAVQQSAVRNIPLALAELDARLTRVLAETLPREAHTVPAGVRAPRAQPVRPVRQEVHDVPGRVFRENEAASARTPARPPQRATTATPPPPERPPRKDAPEQLIPAETGANHKVQQIHDPTATSEASKADDVTELVPGEKGSWNKQLNGDLKPNHKYKVGDYLYETDEMGRVKRVSGDLNLNTRDRNTYQQGKSALENGIKDGASGDDGGHLVASIFDGPGEQINYSPMNSNLNRGEWKVMENSWAKALDEGKQVNVDIRPIYEESSKRPSSFDVFYEVDGVEKFKSFKNAPGG